MKNIEKTVYENTEKRRNAGENEVNMPKRTTLLQDIGQLLIKIVFIGVVFILLFTFLFGITQVTDASMAPSIKEGDMAVFYRLDKKYVASDVLTLEYDGKKQIRRVVAVAGDVVDVTEDGLVINGAVVQELGIYEHTLRYTEGIALPITVGPGQIFVLGDGRREALDSRMYGAVNIQDTLGKLMTVVRRRNM